MAQEIGGNRPGRGSGPGGRGDRPQGGGRGNDRGGGGGRGGGRGDKRGGKGGRGGDRGGREEGGAGGASYRVTQEVSQLEKAMTQKSLTAQKSSLDNIARALRPLHLKSIDQLDFTARGRLLTTLLRVQRQPKPAAPEAPADAAPAEGASPDAPPTQSTPEPGPDAAPAEAATEAAPDAAPAEAISADATPTDSTESTAAATSETKPEEPKAPPPPNPVKEWEAVQFAVGQVWRAVGDHERAETAFASAGRTPGAADDRSEPASSSSDRSERPPRGDRPDRGPRKERAPRSSEPKTGWELHARDVEEKGRTRDAAKIHEQNKSWTEAARLWVVSGDKKSALKALVRGKDLVAARAMLKDLKPEEFRPVLEQAQAWELLMEHYVGAGDFDNVAKLYERARQFDQAALAWERANKFSNARKAFEKAKDTQNANRLRELEVKQLLERGDRLGAATLLVASNEQDKAVEALSTLPPPKAYRFMQRLKLDDHAKKLAEAELQKAEAEGRHAARARWLETLGDPKGAIEAWLAADRKDKALPLIEAEGDLPRAAALAEQILQYDKAVELFRKAGDTANADRVAALPKPETPPPAPPTDKDSDEADEAPPAPPEA